MAAPNPNIPRQSKAQAVVAKNRHPSEAPPHTNITDMTRAWRSFASLAPAAVAFGAPSQAPFNPFSGLDTAPRSSSPAPNPFAAGAKPNPFGAPAAPASASTPSPAFGQASIQKPSAPQSQPVQAQKLTGLAHGHPNGQVNGKRKGAHEEQGRPKQQRMTPPSIDKPPTTQGKQTGAIEWSQFAERQWTGRFRQHH
ncbi:glycoside hydrolase family 10 protein [Apiospora arundinis]